MLLTAAEAAVIFLSCISKCLFSASLFLQYFSFYPTFQAGGEEDRTTQGETRASLAIMSQACLPFNALTCIFGFGPPRVKSPQLGIKPFSTPLTAHFRAVSYKPVAAICIKMGSFVHEEEYRRNMKSLFPVLTAQTF